MRESTSDFKKTRYLFKGTSCFPLSPIRNDNGDSTNVVALEDQMHMILKSLGRQTDSDLSFLTCDYSTLYVRKLEENINYDDDNESLSGICKDLKRSLHKNKRALEIVDLMESLLKLNPFFRPSARECLRNKVFDAYRDTAKENILIEMEKKR